MDIFVLVISKTSFFNCPSRFFENFRSEVLLRESALRHRVLHHLDLDGLPRHDDRAGHEREAPHADDPPPHPLGPGGPGRAAEKAGDIALFLATVVNIWLQFERNSGECDVKPIKQCLKFREHVG